MSTIVASIIVELLVSVYTSVRTKKCNIGRGQLINDPEDLTLRRWSRNIANVAFYEKIPTIFISNLYSGQNN